MKKGARKFHYLEVKLEVLVWFSRSEHSIDVQRSLVLSDSVVRTVCSSASTVAKSVQSITSLSVTRLTGSWSQIIERWRKCCSDWLNIRTNKRCLCVELSFRLRNLYRYLTKDSKEQTPFAASWG